MAAHHCGGHRRVSTLIDEALARNHSNPVVRVCTLNVEDEEQKIAADVACAVKSNSLILQSYSRISLGATGTKRAAHQRKARDRIQTLLLKHTMKHYLGNHTISVCIGQWT